MSPTPAARLRLLVHGTKCAVVGTLAFLAVVTATTTEGVTAGQEYRPTPHQARIDKLMSARECSTDGFGPGVIPGSALVLRDNRVRVTSFDEGWAVYTGEGSGTLVALCLAEVADV